MVCHGWSFRSRFARQKTWLNACLGRTVLDLSSPCVKVDIGVQARRAPVNVTGGLPTCALIGQQASHATLPRPHAASGNPRRPGNLNIKFPMLRPRSILPALRHMATLRQTPVEDSIRRKVRVLMPEGQVGALKRPATDHGGFEANHAGNLQ